MEAEDNRNGRKVEEQEVAMPTDDTAPINELGSLPLIYAVEDRPSWGLSFLLGLQVSFSCKMGTADPEQRGIVLINCEFKDGLLYKLI